MATSIGQYAPVFLPREAPLPDREPWQATVYRVTKNETLPKWSCAHRHRTSFACGSSAPATVECEGGAAAWVAGALAAPGTQGSWRLGQQEIQRSRRVWQPVLASMPQYSCLENHLWQATVYQVAKSQTALKPPYVHKHMIFFPHLWQLCPSER